MARYAAVLLLLFCMGCASSPIPAELATPHAWKDPGTWTFEVTRNGQEAMGAVTFALTNAPAKSCAEGVWRRADLKDGALADMALADWYGGGNLHAAYLISGRFLRLQLNAPACDKIVEMVGTLAQGSATGTLTASDTYSGNTLGNFVAFRSATQPEEGVP